MFDIYTAAKYIRNYNGSEECTFNGEIFFGLTTPYGWTDVAMKVGIVVDNTDNAFYHFKCEGEIVRYLRFIEKDYGFLSLM